jgi:hypothetical protein
MGEDVAAFEIGAELDFVDRDKRDLAIERHRLDRADEILRPRRDDLLLAGDQRHAARPARLDDAVVDFARQQPQRQADHAGGMAEHALHGEVGLARVGGAEDGEESRGRRPRWPVAHRAPVGG